MIYELSVGKRKEGKSLKRGRMDVRDKNETERVRYLWVYICIYMYI